MSNVATPAIKYAERVFNFSPGPATLPLDVLTQAQAEMLNWQQTGVSIMEMGHRDPLFMALADDVVADLAELVALPDSHTILYLHGGARTQFAMVPLNLGNHHTHAHYAVTGLWSQLAAKQAERYLSVEVITEMGQDAQQQAVLVHKPARHRQAAYVHYTPNETVDGIYMPMPETTLPLVADATSTLLALEMDIAAHDIIYASAQKNMGIAGVTFVIIRKSLLETCTPLSHTPSILQYHNHHMKKSMYNTPTTFSLYMSGLMFKWLKKQGGIAAFDARHRARSAKLYAKIDALDCYHNSIHPTLRSPINVTFHLKSEPLTQAFLTFAAQRGLRALKGHRVAGGIRASLYNGMPDAGVDALLSCMDDFAAQC